MDDIALRAVAKATQRKVNRASGLLRESAREIAQLAEGQDVLGVLRVHDRPSRVNAQELIAMGVKRYGAVDVVVIPRPTRRTSPKARESEGASHNGTSSENTAAAH